MRAYVVNGAANLRDLPDPHPKQGEALVRVLAACVGNIDLEILKGYMGFKGVPGHEAGIVERYGLDLGSGP